MKTSIMTKLLLVLLPFALLGVLTRPRKETVAPKVQPAVHAKSLREREAPVKAMIALEMIYC